MKRIILLGLVFLGLTTFAQQKPADPKAEEQAVRSISKNWLALTKKHDAAAEAALFADDGVAYSMNHEPFVGPAAVMKHFSEEFAQNPKEVVDWSTDKVDVAASGDLAVEYGKFNVTGLGPDGTGADMGKYVTVYKKVNGTWKVSADISTSTMLAVAKK
jgi:uncharacterized protein (TIGR02246 family)